jgi:hypothetical protein
MNEPNGILNPVPTSQSVMHQTIQYTQITQPLMPNKFTSTVAISTELFLQSLTPQPTKQHTELSDWHTGLVNCCSHDYECGFCCIACWCPCVAYGMNYSLLVGEQPCNTRFCCCPCILFAALGSLSCFAGAVAAILAAKSNGSRLMQDIAGACQFCMLYQHRYAVGKKAGIYTSDDCCTACAIGCELTWCAPCAQAQLRSEVMYQRQTPQGVFKFKSQRNVGCCKIGCCAKDCGCTGCIETDTQN